MPTAILHEKEEVYVGQKGLQQIVVIHNYVDIMCAEYFSVSPAY